jgi:hypothetical protein
LYSRFTAALPARRMLYSNSSSKGARSAFCLLRPSTSSYLLFARLENGPGLPNTLTSTCSAVQVSMLRDFTLEMWVPSLRWSVAHRRHKKTPIYITCAPDVQPPHFL